MFGPLEKEMVYIKEFVSKQSLFIDNIYNSRYSNTKHK